MKSFDLNSCRSKLEDHYQKTATVPTSVWSKKSVVDIHQIYTRLSWVKEEQTPTGTTQSELKHYTELFTANKNGVIPKRILVQGQTGIGKSTFVKKLLVDWVEVNKGAGDEQAAVLKNFELVVAVNLKEVSKCQSLKDVITLSNVFAMEDKYMSEGLIDYITNNQEKVLLIFDGYDEYRSGCDSEIYEIFSGKSLRSCCVLITTRISKADELRGGEGLHANITGFSEVDRGCFMRRFLNSEEARKLQHYLDARNLMDLAKVPLLLLFFCILWKRGQSADFPENKTKLYMNIIQFILNHSQYKRSPPQYLEVMSFKEILSEIGKVAVQALLKNDHLFEYSQLSDSVRCDESVFIGLFQITEFSETLRPVGIVSFIHKSIQEFLAAWYITYRYIPEGGNLGEIGVNLEVCLALENVFQFMCGLSKEGAFAAFRHLKSVRISNPSLNLSRTVPDVESKTYVPLSDVTDRQWKFSDLVLNSFEEVEVKAKLSRACLDSLGSILLVNNSRSLPEHLLMEARDTHSWSFVSGGDTFLSRPPLNIFGSISRVSEAVKILKILASDGSQTLKVVESVESFLHLNRCEDCNFHSILSFHSGNVYFYITHLFLFCDQHARLLAENVVPSLSANLGQSCLKFLKTLFCHSTTYSMEGFGHIFRRNRLERIRGAVSDDSLCHLLEQVLNPNTCSLSSMISASLTSTGAASLAPLLSKLENVTCLELCFAECSDDVLTRLVAVIKQKTLKTLKLIEIPLSSGAAEALGRTLPELSALQSLWIIGSSGCSLQYKEMEAMFGRFYSRSPLRSLKICNFRAKGSLAPLSKSLCFFPFLGQLHLELLDMGEDDFCGLLENLNFIPELLSLSLRGNPLGRTVRLMVSYLPYMPKLQELLLSCFYCEESFSEEDLDYLREAVREELPQLSIRDWLSYYE